MKTCTSNSNDGFHPSAFINEAVRAHLYPDTRALDAAYKAASSEPWRRQFAEEWEMTEVEDWPE